MPTQTTPQTPPRTQQTRPLIPRRDEPVEVAKAVVERKPYLRMAFANPYNLSLFLGGLAASVLTANPLPALVAAGLEGLWLLHAPDSKLLRRLVWDRRLDKERADREAAERAARLSTLDPASRDRVLALLSRQDEIRRLAAQNPTFTADLLTAELTKTDRLVQSFVDLALTCSRYEQYLSSVDPRDLERDRRRFEQAAKGPEGDPGADIARKNLSIVDKRVERMNEARRYLGVARGQLDLIENSFQLIADQIVTMQSPRELSGQLDELLDGVEAIRETARDTEQILGSLERET